ncbi:MAG TPA: 1-acyl-sn-glycerol-3-phosphate acyltransferase, partial [Flavobacteriales bacterium]|nr:1-acyl-sn-glycerol-3-phosphate acyltransferase [Flavobacteriales bacterium]
NWILRGKITAQHVPLAVVLMSGLIFDFCYNSAHFVSSASEQLLSLTDYLKTPAYWTLTADLFLLAICGGFYVVPLYTYLQKYSPADFRSRSVAANNIFNSFFMVISSLACMAILAIGLGTRSIFFLLGCFNLLTAVYLCQLLPRNIIVSLVKWLLKILFRPTIIGLENYRKMSGNALIIANHTSLLDVPLLCCFLPDKLTFAIDPSMAEKSWLKPFLLLAETFSVAPSNPFATKKIIKKISEGTRCVVFPEGRITATGSLMKIYSGPGVIADKANAVVVPIYIDGAHYSKFSYIKDKIKSKWFPKITVTILPPQQLPKCTENGRKRHQFYSEYLYRLMTRAYVLGSRTEQTLFQSLLDAKSHHGGNTLIAEDIERKPLNYKNFVLRSFLLGKKITEFTHTGEVVGLMLPNTLASAVT